MAAAAAATTNVADLVDLLELGREKLSEGDYLKLAGFLQNLHNTIPTPALADDHIITHNIAINLTTTITHVYKDMTTKVYVKEVRKEYYRNQTRNKETVIYQINDGDFKEALEADFVKYITRLISLYGAKAIVRKLEDFPEQTFHSIGAFRIHISEVNKSEKTRIVDDEDDDEGDDDEHPSSYCLKYVIRELGGLSQDITGS